MTAPSKGPDQHYLLWDGQCGFCRRSVEWIKERDDQDRLFAIPYQQAPSPPMNEPLAQACSRAVHVVTSDGRVHKAGRAVLFALDQVGYGALAKLLSLPPVVWGLELGYWVVARNRAWFSKLFFRKKRSSS